jgi:hypothetical protein
MSPTDQQIREKEVAKSKELEVGEQIISLKTKNTQLGEENESLKNMCKHYESVVSFYFYFVILIADKRKKKDFFSLSKN